MLGTGMTYINRECGCQYNTTHVLAMCLEHAQQLREAEVRAEVTYREYANALSLACAEASACVRRRASVKYG
jgi:hypothetical protein